MAKFSYTGNFDVLLIAMGFTFEREWDRHPSNNSRYFRFEDFSLRFFQKSGKLTVQPTDRVKLSEGRQINVERTLEKFKKFSNIFPF